MRHNPGQLPTPLQIIILENKTVRLLKLISAYSIIIGAMKTVAQKMGIKAGSRAFFKQASAEALSAIDLPDLEVAKRLAGEFDYIHLFVKTQAGQHKIFPTLKKYLKLNGMLWVSWPKGGQLNTDLSLPKVIKIGYEHGLVESTSLSVDATWSALKFTHPKKGKVYNNSHATLQSRTTSR